MNKFFSLRKLSGIGLILVCVLLGSWIVGQFARDATMLTGFCFYIPSPLLIVFVLLTAWAQRRLGNLRTAKVACLAALLPLSWVVFVENSFAPAVQETQAQQTDAGTKPSDPENLRLVHWNVCWGAFGWESIQMELVARSADIYVLSEVPKTANPLAPLLAQLGKEYSAIRLGTMAVLARGELSHNPRLASYGNLQAFPVIWRHDDQAVVLLAVDLTSSLSIARDPFLSQLNEILESQQPDLVVGDLNAPRRSRALDDLPTGYQHAYHSAGSGWGYTWPVPAPMYSLDHCIHGSRVSPVNYELDSSSLSDHRMQVFEFRVRQSTRE